MVAKVYALVRFPKSLHALFQHTRAHTRGVLLKAAFISPLIHNNHPRYRRAAAAAESILTSCVRSAPRLCTTFRNIPSSVHEFRFRCPAHIHTHAHNVTLPGVLV